MFERLFQLAEEGAITASRRAFIGRLGKGAVVVAATVGGVLAGPAAARAGRKTRICATGSQIAECAGQPVGSPCTYGGQEGRCVATSELDGAYYCNECRTKGKPDRRGGR